MHRAHINKGLLIALGVLALIVGGYWTYQYASEPKIVVNPNAGDHEYDMVCSKCRTITKIKQSDLVSQRDTDSGLYKCKKCGTFTAKVERGNSIVPISGGG